MNLSVSKFLLKPVFGKLTLLFTPQQLRSLQKAFGTLLRYKCITKRRPILVQNQAHSILISQFASYEEHIHSDSVEKAVVNCGLYLWHKPGKDHGGKFPHFSRSLLAFSWTNLKFLSLQYLSQERWLFERKFMKTSLPCKIPLIWWILWTTSHRVSRLLFYRNGRSFSSYFPSLKFPCTRVQLHYRILMEIIL